jgi:hypothetical protein
MSFISFLKAVGNDFKKGLPVAIRIAQVADVGISVVNPALGGIIGTSIQTVLNVEQKAQAIAAQGATVTGPQKLAEAVNTLYPAFEQIFGQYGVKIDNTHVEAYVNAIVAALNAFPALPTPAPAPVKTATPPAAAPVAPPVPDVALSTAG